MDEISFQGVESVPSDDLEAVMSVRETPSLLGIRGLLYDWETFNSHVLERDLHRIRRYYASKGYHRANISAGRFSRSDGEVQVTVLVDEGPRTVIKAIRYSGLDVEARTVAGVKSAFENHVALDAPYDEEQLEAGRDAARGLLLNRGYPEAKCELEVDVDLPSDAARVRLPCTPGPQKRLRRVEFHGVEKLPKEVLSDAVNMRPGDLITRDALQSAERELMELGVFTSVQIKIEDVARGDANPPRKGVVYSDLTVTLQRSKTRTLRLGGGVEADVIKSNVHLSGTWRDNNFADGLRMLSLSVTPGLAFYPTRVPDFEAPERLLPQVKAGVQFMQPRPLGRRTRLRSQVDYTIYPVLLSINPPEGAPVVGYREFRGQVGIERSWSKFKLTPSYNLQAGVPFTYVGELAPTASSVYISYLELLSELDFRDDRQRPTKGLYTALRTQGAGVGGTVRDVRLEPEVRGYSRLFGGKTVLASRLKFGFLFPFNYTPPAPGRETSVEDSQIAYFRSFFSGGPGSNRGYPFRGVGPAGHIEFFYPSVNSGVLTECEAGSSDPLCSIPLGGTTLWEFSAEARFPIWGPISGALFCDMSDVSQRAEWESFLRPHAACGVGPRYDTPLGPLRIDVAYRIPGLQNRTDRPDGYARDTFGLPINISFGIGEAF